MTVGQVVHLRAIGEYSNNTKQDVTQLAIWTSSAAAVVSISGGVAAALGSGETTITVVLAGTSATSRLSVIEPLGSSFDFRVAILLAETSPPAIPDVLRVFDKANELLLMRTGARMAQTDLTNVGPGVPSTLARTYLDALPGGYPDGLLALSDDATATSFGGYSLTLPMPPPYANRYPSPSGDTRAYLAVMDFDHKFSRCGYDSTGTTRVSDRSAGGECRNQPGLVCVDNGRYWQCPDSLTDLYSQPDHFPACTIVHEFMHSFGTAGNQDHYGTAECTARTGMSSSAATNRSLFQQHCGMCPDVYLNFRPR
jgi:hypothetical protein